MAENISFMPGDYVEKSDYSQYRPRGYPVRHGKKDPFYPMLSLDVGIRSMMSEIRDLDDALGRYMLSERDYYDLVLDAYSSNIHWSTKIEGNRMTFEEVRSLATEFTAGKTVESPNGPTQEILNHLGFLFQDNLAMPWTVDTVLGVHRILMKGVGQAEPGAIRSTDVSAVGSDGTEFFITCPKGSVREELESLIDWVNTSPFGDIVTAVLFFHEFESIHPFEDGNGRTGRVLFQVLLEQLGLENSGLCRIEERMLGDPGTYYDLMAYTDQTGNYTPLVRYATEAILSAYREAVEKFSEKDRLRDMDENTRLTAIRARKAGTFTLQDAMGRMPSSESSVRKRLDTLVDAGLLEKAGRTRSMRYVFLDPFRTVRQGMERRV